MTDWNFLKNNKICKKKINLFLNKKIKKTNKKLRRNIKLDFKLNFFKKKNLIFLKKINFLKFIYNQKFWIFNYYYYFLSKFLKHESKNIFLKFMEKLELNIFKISSDSIKASLVSAYINAAFKHNYNIYETMRPILVDLKKRMRQKNIIGFKISVLGRFKRAQRATYWWRKDGHLFTSTKTSALDYSRSLHKTKYGVCTISVWLTPGIEGVGGLLYDYPMASPFFFLLKEDKLLKIKYFLLKRNNLFLNNLLKKNSKILYDLEKKYYKGLIMCLLYKYIYTNIFLRNLIIKNKDDWRINKNLKRIFLPQYCIYKIYLEDFMNKNFIKIVPFIQIKLLKRINLRNSYKINFLNKTKLVNLEIFKYKIYLN